MWSRKASIALVVSIVLTTVLTLALTTIATLYYFAERDRQFTALRQGLELTAEQLSSGLASSVWNYDYAQVDRIIAGASKDRNLYGIVVRPADPTRASPVRMRAMVRDAQWAAHPTEAPVPEQGLLPVERPITFAGEPIGTVRVIGTDRFARAELRAKSLEMFASIALLDVLLIVSLYCLLWKIVLNPLKSVEQYAEAVSSGALLADAQASRFWGEWRGLYASIESMVTLLNARYRELHASQSALRLTRFAVERSSDPMFLIRPDGSFAEVNAAACHELGYTREELLALSIPAIDVYYTGENWLKVWRELREHRSLAFESLQRAKDGREIAVELSSNFFEFEHQEYTCTFARNITARKQAEEDKARLEAQLMQAQRMESVGRLAGGVAHDFNNMLGAIFGHTEMAEIALRENPARLPVHLREITKAARRSAALTQQLLAFARKQTITPKALDLNTTVAGMLKLLERMIGEDIEILWLPGSGLWPVLADPSQIDQLLANLCVNARDAIANGGKITIETGNRVLDAAYCADHPEGAPGAYVLLAVSDNGSGMDPATLAQIFEPFFTTKETGKGTGLGLSTVYGIVKQNNGFINVYSEPGQGTTFSIHLPRHLGPAEPEAEDRVAPLGRGHETILLVEDEPAVLDMVTTMLERQGYTVLPANAPGEAIRLARERQGSIHMVMTDIIMPEMNGLELSRRLLAIHPSLKRLFMSGYTASVIAHHGVLDPGLPFIQKPFSMKDLTAKIREVLGQGTA